MVTTVQPQLRGQSAGCCFRTVASASGTQATVTRRGEVTSPKPVATSGPRNVLQDPEPLAMNGPFVPLSLSFPTGATTGWRLLSVVLPHAVSVVMGLEGSTPLSAEEKAQGKASSSRQLPVPQGPGSSQGPWSAHEASPAEAATTSLTTARPALHTRHPLQDVGEQVPTWGSSWPGSWTLTEVE